jgi:hypothetical protein
LVSRTAVALACVALPALAVPHVALADASLADKAAAQTLFDEGRKLMAAGKFAEACPKLAESQKLDPGVGTQFNLADCYEKTGQTASAWAGFLEAASAAKSMGQGDREKVARERAAALVPRLSKITITMGDSASVPELEIKRDGAVVGRALWGTAIPVDPGAHLVEATAPGKKPWLTTAKVEGDRADVVISIPSLESAPPADHTSPSSSSTGAVGAEVTSGGSGRRTVGLVLAGAGIVGLGLGTAFALKAKSNYDDSVGKCDPVDKNLCGTAGFDLRSDARTAGNVATVAFGAGAAALVAGAILYFTAPSGSSDKPRALVVPSAAPGWAGLAFLGKY